MMNKLSTHNIVVVKPAINTEAMDKDPDLLQLQVRNFEVFPSMERKINNDLLQSEGYQFHSHLSCLRFVLGILVIFLSSSGQFKIYLIHRPPLFSSSFKV
jgi:hypothetical protein